MRVEGPNPSGLCMCGCGQPAPIAKEMSRRRGHVKGQPIPYVSGHNRRIPLDECYVVDPVTDCWEWQKKKRADGRGVCFVDGKEQRAHIVMYERKYGPVPEGKELDHLCRNVACVNPDHVEPVIHTVNVWRGAAAKLTVEAAREIRVICGKPDRPTFEQVGAEFGVSATAISNIVNGVSWREEVLQQCAC